jgi:Zn-dependent M28 family amino/carboxypeptidase
MTLLRRTPLCLALALACLAAPAFAFAADDEAGLSKQADATAKILAAPSDHAGEAYALVESLTTEIGPRLAGSPNYDRAMEWAKAKFKALGYDKVYAEPVSFTRWERHHESGAIVGANPQPLSLTALGGTVGTNGPIEAEVVEFDSIESLKSAPAGSLEGKIAFVNKRMERFRDGAGYGPAVKGRAGASEAAAKGAIAYVIRSIGTDSDRMPHTGNQSYTKEVVRKIPAAALSNPDADQISRLLKRGPVRITLNLDVGPGKEYTGYNVIGEITGRGKLRNEVVVIGGHLDSWDLGTGAIDDGAGVAITMAAGARIGRLKQAPRRTIRVIAFCNEEAGLYGGKAYAETHKAELDLQQLGSESDFGAGRIYGFNAGAAPEAEPVIARIASYLQPLGIERMTGKGDAGPDIGPFAKLGMPWAQLAQDGSDYFDYHHTANDTLDKVNSEALDQQVAAYATMAYVAAETTIDFGRSPPQPEKK